jgi:streptogramin lyase
MNPTRAKTLRAAILLLTGAIGLKGQIPTSIVEYPLPSGEGALRITTGPDGALWFTDQSGKIGRITTAGSITLYPTPTYNSYPDGITAGPDGGLWFTEYNAGQIGRITTAGVITEYPLPKYLRRSGRDSGGTGRCSVVYGSLRGDRAHHDGWHYH